MTLTPTFRVVDLETTDFHPAGAVIEIGICDLLPLGPHGEPIPEARGRSTLINPGVPIPPLTSAVHHILDEDVALSPRFDDVAPKWIASDLGVLAFVAHNIAMERHYLGHLIGDTPWICTWKCALHLWPDAPSHSNQVLRYWLNPEGLDRWAATPAHRAGPDAYVTAFLLAEMLKVAPPDQLLAWTDQPALLARIPFGNLKGRPWTEADDGFLEWVLERDFDDDVMFTAAHHQALRRAERAKSTALCAAPA